AISGFGMDNAGEHANRAGLAIVAEAMSGATGLTRDHSGNPVWCGFALGDITAAVAAHAGVLSRCATRSITALAACSTWASSSACCRWCRSPWVACRSRAKACRASPARTVSTAFPTARFPRLTARSTSA
ncbi:MAG: CoA transferase, partial [Betaproteobacteria bacterium]|nr:CoA transferase [Betaproteobacteria bacterium]